MHADRALAGVVCEAAPLRPRIQRQDGVGRQRAETHGRDVEDADVIGLGARGATIAHPNAEIVTLQDGRRHRVVDPFVTDLHHVDLRAEGPLVGLALGALVHQGALLARKGHLLAVGLDEVLPDLRPDELQQEAQVSQHRIVAQDRVARLQHIAQAQRGQRQRRQRPPQGDLNPGHPGQACGHGDPGAQRPRQVTRRQHAVQGLEQGGDHAVRVGGSQPVGLGAAARGRPPLSRPRAARTVARSTAGPGRPSARWCATRAGCPRWTPRPRCPGVRTRRRASRATGDGWR